MSYNVNVEGNNICLCNDKAVAELLNYYMNRLYNNGFNERTDSDYNNLSTWCKYAVVGYLSKRYFAVNNYNYKNPSKINIKGIMLHSPAAPRPDALTEISRDFNKYKEPKESACTHAVIDGNTGKVFQILPWIWRAYHCGGSFNGTHIAVDMCDPEEIKYTKVNGKHTVVFNDPQQESKAKAVKVVDRTYESAVELCTALCVMFGLNPLGTGKGADGKEYPNVILSHREAYVNFNDASNHSDPEKLWSAFSPEREYSMDSFRNAVAGRLENYRKTGDYVPIYRIGKIL